MLINGKELFTIKIHFHLLILEMEDIINLKDKQYERI